MGEAGGGQDVLGRGAFEEEAGGAGAEGVPDVVVVVEGGQDDDAGWSGSGTAAPSSAWPVTSMSSSVLIRAFRPARMRASSSTRLMRIMGVLSVSGAGEFPGVVVGVCGVGAAPPVWCCVSHHGVMGCFWWGGGLLAG